MSSTEPTRPDDLERVVGHDVRPEDETPPEDVREADLRNGEPGATVTTHHPRTQPAGTDTPTGTDPAATYDQPGYEDKSLGQAVAQDRELVDQLMDETDGDAATAEQRFAEESAGRTTLARQQTDRSRREDEDR